MTDILPAIATASPLRAEHSAPTQAELMAELGVRRKPGFLSKWPSWAQVFLSNRKGLFGLIILAIFVIFAALASRMCNQGSSICWGPRGRARIFSANWWRAAGRA